MTDTDKGPATVGEKLTEHEPFDRTHDPPGMKDKLPEGVDDVPVEVSATLAEQVIVTPIVPEEGQLRVVAVDLRPTVKTMVPELIACVESPPYMAPSACVPAPAVGV